MLSLASSFPWMLARTSQWALGVESPFSSSMMFSHRSVRTFIVVWKRHKPIFHFSPFLIVTYRRNILDDKVKLIADCSASLNREKAYKVCDIPGRYMSWNDSHRVDGTCALADMGGEAALSLS